MQTTVTNSATVMRAVANGLRAPIFSSARALQCRITLHRRVRATRNMTTARSRAEIGKSWGMDSDKPFFHVMPRDGWLNDPNGPIFYKGRYHISTWNWGLVWGHASSANLVEWRHEPIAIEPSGGGYDADGCWSGNTAVDTDGSVALLYTGVRLRQRESPLPLPPPEADLGLEQIEAQCIAHCVDDQDLTKWVKAQQPILPLPPGGLGKLTGFRDPFVFQRKADGEPWKMIVGSGIQGKGGTILVYHSQNLSEGWAFKGCLESGRSKLCVDGEGYDLGAMWECPFFVNLEASDPEATWMLCVSPYPHHCTDRPTNPCLYWLGAFNGDNFQMEGASGPKLLDLGDVAYAPTIFRDGKGRCLMLAWLQELRKGGQWDYAGCLSIPRVLTLQDGRLRQDPVEELVQLRQGDPHRNEEVACTSDRAVPLDGSVGQALDVTLTLHRGEAAASGLLLRAWLRTAQEGVQCVEVLVLDWERTTLQHAYTWKFDLSHRPAASPPAVLQVIAPDNLDPQSMTFDPSKSVKSIGGPVELPAAGKSLTLRILIDHSLVEIFTEMGQTLTTRVYRASPPKQADERLFLFSQGGPSRATGIEIHKMGSIWSKESDIPDPTKVYDGSATV